MGSEEGKMRPYCEKEQLKGKLNQIECNNTDTGSINFHEGNLSAATSEVEKYQCDCINDKGEPFPLCTATNLQNKDVANNVLDIHAENTVTAETEVLEESQNERDNVLKHLETEVTDSACRITPNINRIPVKQQEESKSQHNCSWIPFIKEEKQCLNNVQNQTVTQIMLPVRPFSSALKDFGTQTSTNIRKKFSKGQKQAAPRCLIHSIPKQMNCLTCNEQRCPQCLLTEGICKDHKLAESSSVAVQRQKLKLLKTMETTSSDLNQYEFYVRNVTAELQDLEVKQMLRKEEINQEFTSIMDLLIERKNSVLSQLDQETTHRRTYLEHEVKKYQDLQQSEVQLTDEITNLVQNANQLNVSSLQKKFSECEKLSSRLKSALPQPQQMTLTSLLDNPFSLYEEKSQLDHVLTRDSITNGELCFRRKILYIKWRDEISVDTLVDVPCFPASSSQMFKVELLIPPRMKILHFSIPSLEGLILNNYPHVFGPNTMYLLRIRVSVSIKTSNIKTVVNESRPTHMMIVTAGPPFNLSGNSIIQQQSGTNIKFKPPELCDTSWQNGMEQDIRTHHQCITAMYQYENKSLEELRHEDYTRNAGWPQLKLLNRICQEQYGTNITFKPPKGHDNIMVKRRKKKRQVYVDRNVATEYQCITAMFEYFSKSLEELRLEDYLVNRKSKQNS